MQSIHRNPRSFRGSDVLKPYSFWCFNIAMGNGQFTDGLPINKLIALHVIPHLSTLNWMMNTQQQTPFDEWWKGRRYTDQQARTSGESRL
jgi:hypothetical protein